MVFINSMSDIPRITSMAIQAIFSFVAFAGTGLGPVAFGYVELKFGYVLINWILFGISGLSTIGVVLVSRETRGLYRLFIDSCDFLTCQPQTFSFCSPN